MVEMPALRVQELRADCEGQRVREMQVEAKRLKREIRILVLAAKILCCRAMLYFWTKVGQAAEKAMELVDRSEAKNDA